MTNDTRYLKLKYWRQKLGLKQSDLAILLGFNPSNYSQKENGRGKFYLQEAMQIQSAFNKMLKKKDMPLLTLDDIFLD